LYPFFVFLVSHFFLLPYCSGKELKHYISFFLNFWQYWGLNSGLCTFQAAVLPLEPHGKPLKHYTEQECSGQPCVSPDFGGKVFIALAISLSYMAFIVLGYVPSFHSFFRDFIMK
jgi:hypothetical protein